MKLLTWTNPSFSADRLEHISGIKTAHYQTLLANCFRLSDVNYAKANLHNTSYRKKTMATMMDTTSAGQWRVF